MSENVSKFWPSEIRNFLTDKTLTAHSHAEDGYGLKSTEATQVGGLAYLQFVLKSAHELFAEYLDDAVLRDGMRAEQLATALAEHGVSTTAEQLRTTYPKITRLEAYVLWLGQNCGQYLPLLYVVSRLVSDQPNLVPWEYREEARKVHGNLVGSLWDWDRASSSLNDLGESVVGQFAPHRCTWLTHVAVELIEKDADRRMAHQLIVLVTSYYQAGRTGCPAEPVPMGDCAAAASAQLRNAVKQADDRESTELLRVTGQD